MITIPHTNSNLYSVPKFIVFKSQKDLFTRTEVVALEQFYLQTDDGNDIAINKTPPQTFFLWYQNLINWYKIKHSCFILWM
jgi:hypothetical protein